MNEEQFLAKWSSEKAVYEAWASFVKEKIELALTLEHETLQLDYFIKIPVVPRLKKDDSLLGKAFHRGKPYTDAYAEIEDKIGMRFVVLLTADIQKIQKAIEASTLWTPSLDKDFEAERESRPVEFVYQSKHYVLKASADTVYGDITIPAGTPIEVQLRTLLQHAHSELTHDNIYKREPGSEVSKKVERTIAKSMALIEAVDDYFVAALQELESANALERSALADLVDIYFTQIGKRAYIDKSNALILHAFRGKLGDGFRDRILNMLQSKAFIKEQITAKYDYQYMYRQPWILLAYLMVDAEPFLTARNWPLTPDELRPIYTDLGKTFP